MIIIKVLIAGTVFLLTTLATWFLRKDKIDGVIFINGWCGGIMSVVLMEVPDNIG